MAAKVFATALVLAMQYCVLVYGAAAAAAVCEITNGSPYAHAECSGFIACESQLCVCLGVLDNSDPATCLRRAAALTETASQCALAGRCISSFAACIEAISGARTDISNGCNALANALYLYQLGAALGYNSSALAYHCAGASCAWWSTFLASSSNATAARLGVLCPSSSNVTSSACVFRPPRDPPAANYTGNVTLSGDLLPMALQVNSTLLIAYLAADLATAFTAVSNQLWVTNMTNTTLRTVNAQFAFTSALTTAVVSRTWQLLQRDTQRWLVATSRFYATLAASDQIAVVNLVLAAPDGSALTSASSTTAAPRLSNATPPATNAPGDNPNVVVVSSISGARRLLLGGVASLAILSIAPLLG